MVHYRAENTERLGANDSVVFSEIPVFVGVDTLSVFGKLELPVHSVRSESG